jgi:hypothetical protein
MPDRSHRHRRAFDVGHSVAAVSLAHSHRGHPRQFEAAETIVPTVTERPHIEVMVPAARWATAMSEAAIPVIRWQRGLLQFGRSS